MNRVIEANDLPAKTLVTTDRHEAVEDADYVIFTYYNWCRYVADK